MGYGDGQVAIDGVVEPFDEVADKTGADHPAQGALETPLPSLGRGWPLKLNCSGVRGIVAVLAPLEDL
ncbi:hypothetical protein NHF46_01115 [Arthrobacter alpinus]|nr:hypothetical protein [Arthrobacter alpinus]